MDDLSLYAQTLVAGRIVRIERIVHGKNNRIYRADTDAQETIIIKQYAPVDYLGRDRRATEYAALQFLSAHGFTNIARPIGTSSDLNVAVYEFLSGKKLLAAQIDMPLIEKVAHFFCSMRQLGGPHTFPAASEAFFQGAQIMQNIEGRLQLLQQVNHKELQAFLSTCIVPSLQQASQAVQNTPFFTNVLDRNYRMLSPSDVGFHNMLLKDGQPQFVDFEYFGWDDPVKLLCDFITQHDLPLTSELAQSFITAMLPPLTNDPELLDRFVHYLPLFTIKKALIALNEFLPKERSRREFALNEQIDSFVLESQLLKAQALLTRAPTLLQLAIDSCETGA